MTSPSSYQLNTTSQTRPAKLNCGDLVESRRDKTHMSIGSNDFVLFPASRARVCRELLTLEAGSVQFNVRSSFVVRAGELQFIPEGASTRGKISLASNRQINAAVASGKLLAAKPDGSKISDLTDGQNVTLQPTLLSSPAETKVTGCIEKRDRRYYLRDENSNVTFELGGENIAQNERHRAVIEGSVAESGAHRLTQYLQAATVQVLGKTCRGAAGFTPLQTASIVSGIAVGSTVVAIATMGGNSPAASPSGLP